MAGKNKAKKDNRLSQKRKVGGAVAALLAAFTVYAVMLQTEKSILTKYEKATVYVVAEKVTKGQLITEGNLERFFQLAEVDQNCVSVLSLCDPKDLVGRIAACDMEVGAVPTPGMFLLQRDILAQLKEPVIAGFKAEDLYQVIGGVLRAGDRIHIYTVNEEETTLLWENVFVQCAFDQAGNRIENGDETTAAQRLNVYLNKADVETFYSGLAGGSLRVVKAEKE